MGTDPAGGIFIGLHLGRKLASLPQSRSIDAARRVIDSVRGAVVEHDLAAPGAPSLVEHGITAQTFAGDLAPAEASHVIGQVERVLDAEVLVQNRAAAAESVTTTKGKSMSKLSAVADRIKATRAKLDAEADKLMARLDGVDAKAPALLTGANSLLDQQDTEIGEFEAELRQLSNLPLASSGQAGS